MCSGVSSLENCNRLTEVVGCVLEIRIVGALENFVGCLRKNNCTALERSGGFLESFV